MIVKTPNTQYKMVEFNHYIDQSKDEAVSVVDFVIEADDMDVVEEDFNNILIVYTDECLYSLSDYELLEIYDIGAGLIRVMCVN